MLDLAKRTLTFSETILVLCRSTKITFLNRNILEQLLRSGTSIGANYREACGTVSKRDFANRLSICKREALETVYWLKLLLTIETTEQLSNLISESQELVKIFSKSFHSASFSL